MVRKNYPDEFKRDAVALYRDTEGATITAIADEIGVSGATLSAWCKAAGCRFGTATPPVVPYRYRARKLLTRSWPGYVPKWGSSVRTRPGCPPSATFCGRRPNISPGRRTGEPLPVRRRPPRHLSGEVAVRDRRDRAFSFYAWLAGADGRAAREAADQALAERIRIVHEADNTYGAPRITAELNDGVPEQEQVNHKRVARVMRAAKIAGYRRRRRSRPQHRIRPTRRSRTCSTGISPQRQPTKSTSETSPTCPWRPGRICISRR